MKIFLCSLIPILCGTIGYYLSNRFFERKTFFEDFYLFHKNFKSEIAFTSRTVNEILGKEYKDTDFYNFTKNYIEKSQEIKCNYLSEEEIMFLKNYLDNLGVSDRKTQMDFYNSLSDKLEEYVLNSRNSLQNYRPLYIKLGFLFGLIIFILLI